MQLKTKVKVGNITNLSDARYCAGMGVDLLGFPIGNAAEQISLNTFLEIAEWVAGPEFILEYTDMDNETFQKVTTHVQHVQVDFNQLQRLGSHLENLSIILKTTLEEWDNIKLSLSAHNVNYVVLAERKPPEWELVHNINSSVKVLVPQEFVPDMDKIETLPIAGIILEGSSEDKPGQKDYDHLANVLESLEVY